MENFVSSAVASILGFFLSLFPQTPAPAPASVVSAISAKPAVAETLPHAKIIFGGDMMFDRSIRRAISEKGGDFVFSCIEPALANADVVVANLEGPITTNSSVSIASKPGGEFNYTFTFSPSTVPLLFARKVYIVNIGNNHIQNFGKEGVLSTISALRAADVAYFGDPIDQKVAEGKVKGVKFAFINYNEFSGENALAASTTISQIQNERAGGFLPVVYTHWGIEYATTSSANSRELAHSFVDAGAEIVIGSHPHVVQEHEIYGSTKLTTGKGKNIYYSLGNFIFDQYFSDDVRHGLLLLVDFSPAGVQSVKEIPIELENDGRACPMQS